MRAPIDELLDEIQDEARLTQEMTGVAAISSEVVAALRATPRETFVASGLEAFAYTNQPLPIGHGQTISQPFIVALMTELLRPRAGDTILEIGAGSGYQAAVLARLVRRVVSIEILPPLADLAAQALRERGIRNVEVHLSDGRLGWPAAAPYDGIIVTACGRAVPQALIDQLKPGGRLVVPIGEPRGPQELTVLDKAGDGEIRRHPVLGVAFVPLTGGPDLPPLPSSR